MYSFQVYFPQPEEASKCEDCHVQNILIPPWAFWISQAFQFFLTVHVVIDKSLMGTCAASGGNLFFHPSTILLIVSVVTDAKQFLRPSRGQGVALTDPHALQQRAFWMRGITGVGLHLG